MTQTFVFVGSAPSHMMGVFSTREFGQRLELTDEQARDASLGGVAIAPQEDFLLRVMAAGEERELCEEAQMIVDRPDASDDARGAATTAVAELTPRIAAIEKARADLLRKYAAFGAHAGAPEEWHELRRRAIAVADQFRAECEAAQAAAQEEK